MTAVRTFASWSSGKDSAWMVHGLQHDPEIELAGLLTTVNETHDRVAMHAVRRELLQMQADALRLPLITVDIPSPCSNAQYEIAMKAATDRLVQEQVRQIAFGDLLLADVKAYREQQMRNAGLIPMFPLWQRNTAALAREMIRGGLKAIVTCVDPKQLSSVFAGREFDDAFVDSLPEGVDPCGENGEFHTFAYAGPMFSQAIAVRRGVTVERDGFVFTDLEAAT